MEMLGIHQVPIARVFTKADKLKSNDIEQSLKDYNDLMLENWEELPLTFITSSKSKRGREELLDFIEQSVNNYRKGL
jgi:GTP-binding protein